MWAGTGELSVSRPSPFRGGKSVHFQPYCPLPAPLSVGYFSLVRTLFASALLALACGCSDPLSRPSGAGAPPSIPGGPDPVMLRVSRDGGPVVAYPYPKLDSALWRSGAPAPALDHIIAFGAEDGYLAGVDVRGSAVRVDLRLGTVSTTNDSALRAVSSADGAAIYALTPTGDITRFTPSGGDWKFTPPLPAAALFAQADGALIIAGARGTKAIVWRIRPPGVEIVDSLSMEVGGDAKANNAMIEATAGSVGDRIFFGAHESVIAVRSRDMKKALEIDLGDPITAIAATPSGDRLFVALEDDRKLRVVDRFDEKVSGKIRLPSAPHGLRMDPLGRVLLVHGTADSVFVVSLGDDQVIGTVRSAWRGDLPQVMADGTVALARGDAVVITTTILTDGRTIARGATEFWGGLRWNGFRPRSAGLDQPVHFRTSAPRDSSDVGDSAQRDSVRRDSTRRDSTRTVARDSVDAATPLFTVAFAAVQDEQRAQALASRIRVDGQSPRVTTTERNGTTLYRVVLGPFPTRAEADRVGKASGQSYWIFEGAP